MALELAKAANKKILVIDPSGSHLAYALAEVNGDTMTFTNVGMLWVSSKWELGQRLDYMYRGVKLLLNYEHIIVDSVYTEGFFMNKFKMSGVSVIPTINNNIQMAIHQIDTRVGYKEVSPSTWRNVLGIKHVLNDKGARDYKEPTAQMVKKMVTGKLPEQIVSNITGKQRDLPNDITDVMAITLSVGKTVGCKKFELGQFCFNEHRLLEKIRGLNEQTT